MAVSDTKSTSAIFLFYVFTVSIFINYHYRSNFAIVVVKMTIYE